MPFNQKMLRRFFVFSLVLLATREVQSANDVADADKQFDEMLGKLVNSLKEKNLSEFALPDDKGIIVKRTGGTLKDLSTIERAGLAQVNKTVSGRTVYTSLITFSNLQMSYDEFSVGLGTLTTIGGGATTFTVNLNLVDFELEVVRTSSDACEVLLNKFDLIQMSGVYTDFSDSNLLSVFVELIAPEVMNIMSSLTILYLRDRATEIANVVLKEIASWPKSRADENKILGGRFATRGEFPFAAGLTIGASICGASIVSSTKLVTACHCVADLSTGFPVLRNILDITVRVGSVDLNHGPELQKRDPIRTLAHPKCEKTLGLEVWLFDVGLIEVGEAIKFGRETQPQQVYSQDLNILKKFLSRLMSYGAYCQVIGWGTQNKKVVDGEDRFFNDSTVLKVAQMEMVTMKNCFKLLCKSANEFCSIPVALEDTGEICAQMLNTEDTDCLGDSGGPLICRGYVVAVVSWGVGCGQSKSPNFYARIDTFLDVLYPLEFNKTEIQIEKEIELSDTTTNSTPLTFTFRLFIHSLYLNYILSSS